jgi:hypothetical protein
MWFLVLLLLLLLLLHDGCRLRNYGISPFPTL